MIIIMNKRTTKTLNHFFFHTFCFISYNMHALFCVCAANLCSFYCERANWRLRALFILASCFEFSRPHHILPLFNFLCAFCVVRCCLLLFKNYNYCTNTHSHTHTHARYLWTLWSSAFGFFALFQLQLSTAFSQSTACAARIHVRILKHGTLIGIQNEKIKWMHPLLLIIPPLHILWVKHSKNHPKKIVGFLLFVSFERKQFFSSKYSQYNMCSRKTTHWN